MNASASPTPRAATGSEVELVAAPTLCFAMEQSGVPLVRSCVVRHHGPEPLHAAELVLRLEPGLGELHRQPVPDLLPGETADLGVIDYRLPAGKLRQVTEAERASLTWSLRAADRDLATGTADVQVLAYNQWPGLRAPPGLLASFVTPNHPVVTELLKRTAARLEQATGKSALDGYQSRDPARVRAMVGALYDSIASLGLTYADVPASFERSGQKVRLPDQVLSEQIGCCLDLSVLFASCLEQLGLAPLLVIVKGHAFPSVWLVDDRFPEGLVEDAPRLRNQLALGQIVAFESTAVTSKLPFDVALAAGVRGLVDETFHFALDVRASRTEFRPLPLRAVGVPAEADAQAPQRVEIVRILKSAASEPEGPPPPPPVPEDVAARFRRWKDRLLDLTLRNRLLNFRSDRKDVLPLDIPDLATFEDLLAGGEHLELVGRPPALVADERDEKLARARRAPEEDRALLLKDLARRVLHSRLVLDDLHRHAVELVRAARTDMEEGGASTLFVALGILKWKELATGKERFAPLVLYPAEVLVERTRRRLTLRRLSEDPVANVTLIEKLRRDFGIDLSELAELSTDDAGLDMPKLLDGVRRAVQSRSGFEVLEEAHVARLSFAKFLMWKDLEDNAAALLENPVVRHIAGTASTWQDTTAVVPPAELDQQIAPHALPSVLDADSTQLSAIVSALRGKSFVLQGPPGTGKSQTITNLVAAAIAEGKTVLFVSEKMAALEVVHRRLQAVGLRDFCLELHSHKANKKDVLRSLGAVADRASRTRLEQWEGESKRLHELRGKLNAYAQALHRPRPAGFTLYEAAARLRELAGEPDLRAPVPDAAALTKERLLVLRDAASELADRAAAVEPVDAHRFRASRRRGWSAADEEKLADELDATIAATDAVETAAREAEGALGVKAPRSLAALSELAALARATSLGALPEAALDDAWQERERRARAHLSADEARRSGETELLSRWQPELLRDDPAPLLEPFRRWATAFFLFALLFLFGPRRRLKALARSTLGSNLQIRDDLARAAELRQESKRLEAERAELAGLLDRGVLDRGADLRAAVHLPRVELAELARRSGAMAPERRALLAKQADALAAAVAELSRAEEAVRALGGFSPGEGWPLADEPRQCDALRTLSTELRDGLSTFRPWCLYREAVEAAVELGLGPFAVAHRDGRLPAARIPAAVERNILGRWHAATSDAEPLLRSFDGRSQDRLVETFNGLDEHHQALSQAYVVARAEERLPPPGAQAASGSEMQLLRRELAKKTRQLAVRRLLQGIPTLLPRLKPCLLMSPLSVAQYLPPNAGFDLVVFDEASQIGTHDAIGAIARGKQVVIVGDSRQLPPTAFFQRASDDEDALPDENDIAELESVLDEAQAKGLPQQMLGWHYRSRHDALIDFSNRHYYEGRLFVFPAARQIVDDLGVKWHPVPDGVFLSGGDRTNPAEAKRLVEHLVGELRRTEPAARTFGVVTFSLSQRTLVEDLLDEARAAHPEIEPHFTSAEPVFVKNLENVQGDERDEIYFSIGYAKDEAGRLRMHFGPLSTSGGERRLNVAITRARCQMRVFSTLRAEDIDLARTGAVGARHLRSFLQFAARGAEVREAGAGPAFESRFHREVHDAIVAAGYRVATSVGCAGYRVDLAIERPESPGVYALGDELDGPRWARAEPARERERLRKQVLASLGWRMHRVWTPEWSRSPADETNRILRALEAALAEKPAAEAPKPRPVQVTQVVASARPPIETWLRTPPVTLGDVDDLTTGRAAEKVRRRLEEVVAFEGPLHEDELVERVAHAFGVQRLGARVARAIDEQLEIVIAAGKVAKRGPFVWPTGIDPSSYVRCRALETDGSTRDLQRLPPEEIARVAAWVLDVSGTLSEPDWAKETAKALGVGRVTKLAVEAVEEGLRLARTRARAG